MMSVLCDKTTLIVCQFLFSTLPFGLFKVSSRDAAKLLFSMDFASFFLLTWSIPITYMTDPIVCVFVLSCFKYLGLLCSTVQVDSYSFIFRDVGFNLVQCRGAVGDFNNHKFHMLNCG